MSPVELMTTRLRLRDFELRDYQAVHPFATVERNAGWHGWLSVGVAFKINQVPRQGSKELSRPVSGRLAGKVRVDQADGGGTFAHRCCHPFD
jgi:hypothetical protein